MTKSELIAEVQRLRAVLEELARHDTAAVAGIATYVSCAGWPRCIACRATAALRSAA